MLNLFWFIKKKKTTITTTYTQKDSCTGERERVTHGTHIIWDKIVGKNNSSTNVLIKVESLNPVGGT